MQTTKILYKDDAREKLLAGITKVYQAVKSTLGPGGSTVFISSPIGVGVTKDGYTVAKNITLNDPAEKAGAEAIKQASSRTVETSGDGTSSATVLAYHIINECLKSGVDIKHLCETLLSQLPVAIEKVREKSIPVKGDMLKHVAFISSNGDEEIARACVEVYTAMSADGSVLIENSGGHDTRVEVTSGFIVNAGLNSPAWINNPVKQRCELKNVSVCIIPDVLSSFNEAAKIGEAALKTGKPLVIVAQDVTGEALKLLSLNAIHYHTKGQGFPICVVKSREFGVLHDEMFSDLADYTGAVLLSEKGGRTPDSCDVDCLGSASMFSADRDRCVVSGGGGDQSLIDDLKQSIRSDIERASSEELKHSHRKRLSRLDSGVAVIYVGAHTPAELEEKKYRVDDAEKAARCAIKGGVVPGGGIALFRASSYLADGPLKTAMQAPLREIILNAGDDPAGVIDKLNSSIHLGYDARSHKFVDMIDAGIIDPADVVCSALENAVSVAVTVLSSSAIIVNEPS